MVALLAAVAGSVARWVGRLPLIAPDTWAMVSSFADLGMFAYAAAAVLLLVSVLLATGRARIGLLVAAVLLACLHGSWLVPDFVADDESASPARVRVLTQNLLRGEADLGSLAAASAEADVVVLVELTRSAADALTADGFDRQFPYASGGGLPRSGPAGTRIYSRYPLTAGERLDPAGDDRHWRALVTVPQLGAVTVVAVHPRRPRFGGRDWETGQRQVLDHVPTTRTVVAGDLNAVDSHPSLRRYADLGFRGADDLAGAGWQPTFPAHDWVPALIGIDHVLVSSDLTATDFRTVRVTGSDHLGVLAAVGERTNR